MDGGTCVVQKTRLLHNFYLYVAQWIYMWTYGTITYMMLLQISIKQISTHYAYYVKGTNNQLSKYRGSFLAEVEVEIFTSGRNKKHMRQLNRVYYTSCNIHDLTVTYVFVKHMRK